MTIHQRIKERRLALNISMETLATRVGLRAWQTVQQWEKEGGTAPNRGRIERVAKVLGTTVEWLQSGKPEADVAGQALLTEASRAQIETEITADILRIISAYKSADRLGRDTLLAVVENLEMISADVRGAAGND